VLIISVAGEKRMLLGALRREDSVVGLGRGRVPAFKTGVGPFRDTDGATRCCDSGKLVMCFLQQIKDSS